MPPLTDAGVLTQFRIVLANWNFTGYVTAKDRALDWIANNLKDSRLKDIAKAMHVHVQTDGVIDAVPEKRSEWSEWPFHYDFRLQFAGRMLYIETILQDDDPSDPTIRIVSIYDA